MHATILAAGRRLALPQSGGHFQPPVWRLLVMTELRFLGWAVRRHTVSDNAHLENTLVSR